MLALRIMLILSFTIPNTYAALRLEPYFGIGNTKTKIESSSVDDDERDDFKAIGAKIGFTALAFDAGIDYQVDTDADFTRNHLSAYIAMDFPILLRVWAEIGLNSVVDYDGLDGKLKLKNGTSLGVAFTGLPFIHINLEFEKSKYDGDVKNENYDSEWDSYLLSVSWPLEF